MLTIIITIIVLRALLHSGCCWHYNPFIGFHHHHHHYGHYGHHCHHHFF